MMNTNIETIAEAQADMRQGYGDGATGVMTSGLVWLIAAGVAYGYTDQHAIWTLFFGGMMIFPVSSGIEKILGLRGGHTKGNALGTLAMEGTIWMLFCMPLAFMLARQQSAWFFQGMLLIIGGRYLSFATIYGKRIYWVLGAVLGLAAYGLFITRVQTFGSALTGAIVEIVMGAGMLLVFFRQRNKRIVSQNE